jgi:hypothetical protein
MAIRMLNDYLVELPPQPSESQVADIDIIPSASSLPVSASDIIKGTKDLQSVLDFIGTHVNTLDGVLKAMESFAQVVWLHYFHVTPRPHLSNYCS